MPGSFILVALIMTSLPILSAWTIYSLYGPFPRVRCLACRFARGGTTYHPPASNIKSAYTAPCASNPIVNVLAADVERADACSIWVCRSSFNSSPRSYLSALFYSLCVGKREQRNIFPRSPVGGTSGNTPPVQLKLYTNKLKTNLLLRNSYVLRIQFLPSIFEQMAHALDECFTIFSPYIHKHHGLPTTLHQQLSPRNPS